jgi:hypothetical protein
MAISAATRRSRAATAELLDGDVVCAILVGPRRARHGSDGERETRIYGRACYF